MEPGNTMQRASGSKPPSRRTRVLGRRSARGGFTLAETALAMVILLVALLSMSAATLRMHTLRRQNRERVMATNAMRSIGERIRAVAEESLGDPTTWSQNVVAALQPGGEIGDVFNVGELRPVRGAQSVGSVTVVVDETSTDAALGIEMGLPRDLDGDGIASNTDVSASARLLPIIVETEWLGVSGEITLRHPVYLLGY